MNALERWVEEHGIVEIECLVPDMNGVLRGKVLPAAKLVRTWRDGSLRLPSSVFAVTVTGEYAGRDDDEDTHRDPDMLLVPDLDTLRVAPGMKAPTAFVFADAHHPNGSPWASSPRHVLKAVIALYESLDWRPVVAPELEFYLTGLNPDPDIPLTPPAGRSGRAESAPQPYGLEAISEFETIIDGIYESSEIASLNLDTMIHESGTAQLEINFLHGDPVALSDQVLVFKRIVRQVALDHGVYATFMAKPMESISPAAPCTCTSRWSNGAGDNLFADASGADTAMFRHYIGGLQTYLPLVAPLFAPNVNSFRRMRPSHSAPINVQWGEDNRSCGLRVPISDRRQPADREPPARRRRQPLSGHRRDLDQRAISALSGSGSNRARSVTGNAYHHARTLPRTSTTRSSVSPPATRCAICWASRSPAPSPASRRPSWRRSRA